MAGADKAHAFVRLLRKQARGRSGSGFAAIGPTIGSLLLELGRGRRGQSSKLVTLLLPMANTSDIIP